MRPPTYRRRPWLSVGEARRAAAAIMAVVESIDLHERDRDPAARNELVSQDIVDTLGVRDRLVVAARIERQLAD